MKLSHSPKPIPILTVSFICISLLLVSAIMVKKIENDTKASYKTILQTMLASSNESLRLIYQHHKNIATYWSSNKDLIKLIEELVTLQENAEPLKHSNAQNNIRKLLSSVIIHAGFRGFFIIDNKNINIASTRDWNIGVINVLENKNPGFLDKVRHQGAKISLPVLSDVPIKDKKDNQYKTISTMFSAAPIKNIKGETIAVLTFRLEPDDILSGVLQKGQIGESGDTYALMQSGLMLSESRFNHQLYQYKLIDSPLHSDLQLEIRDPGVNLAKEDRSQLNITQHPLTTMAQSVSHKKTGSNLDPYNDYRGVSVIGAWVWDEQLGFAIASEIDSSEAYRILNKTRLLIMFFTLLTISLIIVISIVFTKNRNNSLRREKYIKSIVDNTAEAIVNVDARGTILLANSATYKIFGYQNTELLNQNINLLIPQNHHQSHSKYMEMTAQDISQTFNKARDINALHKTGQLIPIEINISIMVDSNEKNYICIIRDITKRKQQQQQLDKALQQAKVANNAKSQFLSQMSHELRTPLNAIMGFAQLLEINSKSLSLLQKDNVNEISMAGKHLLNLINEILDLSKIESGKLELSIQNVSIDELVKQCIQLIYPQIKASQLQLQDSLSDKNYIVLADPSRLKQIIINLLSNAVKYNSEQGQITLAAEVKENHKLRIQVSDTGKGLSQTEVAKLFTPFERLNAKNNIEGTGIGLVITKNLIKLMDGNIGIESTPGKGSTFWIELKLV